MRKFPHASVILFVILFVATAVTWILPSVTYETVYDEEKGYEVIDESTVVISEAKKVSPLMLPVILVEGVSGVLSTLILICVSIGAFSVLSSSGMFDILILRLCERFKGRETRLVLTVFTGFSCLGLVVIPHVFIPFTPLIITLALRMGFDPIVGLAMVLFGATTASMTGPLSAVTAMCQESVGLDVYSGAWARFLLFALFHIINSVYLVRYAKRVRKDPAKSLLCGVRVRSAATFEMRGGQALTARHKVALVGFGLMFAIIIFGSAVMQFSASKVSGVFLTFALVAGPVLGYSLSETVKRLGEGIKMSVSTLIVISIAGAVTEVMRQGGIFTTLLYFTSSMFSRIPGFLVPTGMLFLVSLLNCVLPSGPAKGVLLMPLLGPAAQMSGMTLQTSVLSYTLGDSFSNYMLPYDSTTASYLETSGVPFSTWVRFVWKLFIIWNLMGIAALTLLNCAGYS